jgi:hypothetical protein
MASPTFLGAWLPRSRLLSGDERRQITLALLVARGLGASRAVVIAVKAPERPAWMAS